MKQLAGLILISTVLAVPCWSQDLDPGNFADPANTVCEILTYDTTAGVLGFIGSGATGPICIDPTGAITFGSFVQHSVSAGLTASTNQTQGQGALTSQINEVSTVANDGDTRTLPAAVTGREITVINNGENKLQIFPASGDNLGSGLNLPTTLDHADVALFAAYDNANWESATITGTAHGQADDEDNTDVFVVNDAGGDFHSYHSNGFIAGDLQNWTFDTGGAGTSFPIASVANSAGFPGSQILVTTTGSHGLAVGDILSQTNLSDPAYAGIFEVKASAAATTYEVTAVFTATGTGTMDQAATLVCGVGVGGTYQIAWYASATSATNNETLDFELFLDASSIRGTKVRRKFGTAMDFGSFSGGSILDISDGEKISLALSNEDSASNITMRNLVIILTRL